LAQQNLNVGTNPNDGTGDPIRTAMIKVQNNFSDLYTNYVSNAQLTANLDIYQTLAGLSANVINVTANNTNFVGSVSAANVVSNAQLAANLSGYVTSSALSANLGNYASLAGLSSNVATLTANNSVNLGGVAASKYVNTSADYTITGNHTYTANVTINDNLVLAPGSALYANGSLGSPGQALISNGSAVAWSNFFNGNNQYTFNNTVTFSNTLTIGALSSNGGVGSAGYLLASNGSATYWTSTALNANSAAYVGSVPASNIVTSTTLASNLSNYQLISGMIAYQTTAGLASNVATLTSNNASYLGSNNNLGNTSGIFSNATISSAYILVNSQTSNYTLANSDSGKVITIANSAASVTLTVPNTLPVGFRTLITKIGTANVNIVGNLGLTLGSRTGSFILANTYGSVSIFQASSTLVVVDGSI
jgi:hypothetical protein